MAKNDRERELDDAEPKARLAMKLIGSARNTAQLMGVGPAPWIYALIDEMALVIVTQAGASGTSIETVQRMLGEAVQEMLNNPRIVAARTPQPTISVILLTDEPDESNPDDPMQQVHDAIAKGAKRA